MMRSPPFKPKFKTCYHQTQALLHSYWNQEVWQQLPPQDKRHFRFLYRRRRFRPSNQGIDEPKALPISTEEMRHKQHSEVEATVGEIPEEERQRIEAAKQEMRFTVLGGRSRMKKLLVDDYHLLYSPTLANLIGRNEATILQQIYYWTNTRSGKLIDGVRWFYKTYKDWATELRLSVSTIRRAIAHLKQHNLILVEKQSKQTCYHVYWYTINHEACHQLWESLSTDEHIEDVKPIDPMCSKRTLLNIDSSSKDFSTQQHSAAAEIEFSPNRRVRT